MTFEMVTCRIKDIADVVGGGTPSTKRNEFYGGDIPWITPKDLSGYNDVFIGEGARSITETGLKGSSARLIPKNSVLFTSRAPIGYVAISSNEVATNQGFKSLTPKQELLDYKFAYYMMKHYAPRIEAIASGSTFKEVSGNTVKNFEVTIPKDLSVQRSIAETLFSLDSKITLNTRMNQTLEKIAQRIFKSWFIDFDPVKANAEGVPFDGLSPEIQALFPSELVESEMGLIPRGWSVDKVGSVVERCKVGKRYSRKETQEKGCVPVIDQGREGVIGFHDNAPDVLASPEFPVITFANHTCKMDVHWYNFSAIQNVLPFRSSKAETLWLFFATIGKQEHTEYKGHWPEFEFQTIILPPKDLTSAFSSQIESFMKRIWINSDENKTLSKIRDNLLPKLISGQIEINNEAE